LNNPLSPHPPLLSSLRGGSEGKTKLIGVRLPDEQQKKKKEFHEAGASLKIKD